MWLAKFKSRDPPYYKLLQATPEVLNEDSNITGF